MIRALLRYAVVRSRERRWLNVRCLACGQRRGDVDLRACETPSLTIVGTLNHRDPHRWADQ